MMKQKFWLFGRLWMLLMLSVVSAQLSPSPTPEVKLTEAEMIFAWREYSEALKAERELLEKKAART